MSNADARLRKFRDRLNNVEQQRRAAMEDAKELAAEMKSAGLSKAEIAGVKLAVRRDFESDDRKAMRTAAEEVADSLALSGSPLFAAAANA